MRFFCLRSVHFSSETCALFGYEIRYKTQFLHICLPLKSQRLYLYAYADFDIILHINWEKIWVFRIRNCGSFL